MIKHIILTLPFFVTFFWALTLWLDSSRTNNNPKKNLALFMSIASLLYVGHAVYFSLEYTLYSILDPSYTFASLSVFPLFYIYIKSLTKGEISRKKDFWILSPAIFFSLTSVLLYTLMGSNESVLFVKKFIYNQEVGHSFSSLAQIHNVLYKAGRITFAIQLIPSTYFSWKLIHKYERNINEFYSSTENKSLAWTGKILTATVLASIFAFILNTIGKSFFINHYLLIFIPSLLFSFLLYTIGYLGIRQKFYIQNYKSDIKKEKDSNNSLNDSSRSKLYVELLNLLEEQMIFRNPELRITDLSRQLNTNRTYISGIVNTKFKSTFCDLVNHYRVEYSKKLLMDPKLYILEYISNESGFASINSFLRAFKKETGTTPGQYRKFNIKK